MALVIDIAINKELIYHVGAERFPKTPPRGTNPYKVTVFTPELDELGTVTVVHPYEDGPIALAQRALQGVQNEPKISKQIAHDTSLRTSKTNTKRKS